MERDEALELLKKDPAQFNKFKADNPRLRLDLHSADLEGQNLAKADLRRANLEAASFRRANLEGAELNNCRLVAADFREANLDGANFHRAQLQDADLRGARLGTFDGESLRLCCHAELFRGVRLDREHLEEFLRVLNLNRDWEIRYQIVPKVS